MKKQTTAQILRLGLLLKYLKKEDVLNWAEKRLQQGDNDPCLLDLIFPTDKTEKDVLTILKEIIGYDVSGDDISKAFFLGFYNYLLIKNPASWEHLEREVLNYFSVVDGYENDDEKLFISRLNNDYSLRKEGLGGAMEMPDDLIIFLRKHDRFLALHKELEKEGGAVINFVLSWDR